MLQNLCNRIDLESTGAKEVILHVGGARYSVAVIKDGAQVRAYMNSCPHNRAPLNWQADKFFDLSRQYLLCANHGALFDPATGRCMHGPAKGKGLTPITVLIKDDRVVTDPDSWPRP